MGKTPKRHFGYANSAAISSLDRGRLSGWHLRDKSTKVATAVKYQDRSGKTRYKGTAALRSTEQLDNFQRATHLFQECVQKVFIYVIVVFLVAWKHSCLLMARLKTFTINNGQPKTGKLCEQRLEGWNL